MTRSETFWKTVSNFYTQADQLKSEFDKAFAEPLKTKPERFCWDYWYVKDQYKLLRTPADHFFSDKLYSSLQKKLQSWGQSHLGCKSISPMWLSYYIDGCEQQLHTDSPHGPWAFVYSITDWENRIFQGGETFLLKPETLCYWDFFDLNKGAEKNSFIETIEPHFNQLTVFDPRFPHGVQKVMGAHEPSQSRIVIHGWFTDPEPQFFNLENSDSGYKILDTCLEKNNEQLAKVGFYHGLLSFKFYLNSNGKVTGHEVISNTLIDINSQIAEEELINLITQSITATTFPKNSQSYELVLPFLFK